MSRRFRVRRWSVLIAAGGLCAATLMAPQAAQALTPGWLDPTYGASGVGVAPGASTDLAGAGAVDSSGRALLLSATDGTPAQFQVTRLTVDGTVDTAFGTAGTTTLPVGPDYSQLLIGSDGIYVAGLPQSGNGIAITRLSLGGALDSTYGSGGLATAAIPAVMDFVGALAQLTSGDLVVTSDDANAIPSKGYIAAVTPAGVLDSTWNPSGTTPGSVAEPDGFITIAADGNQVVYAEVNDSDVTHLHRLTATGTPDTGFGPSGAVTVASSFLGQQISVGPDGDYYVGGGNDETDSGPLEVVRVLPAGTVDATFGVSGMARVKMSDCGPTTIQTVVTADFVYLFGLHGACGPQPIIARLTTAGGLDTSFGSGGFLMMSSETLAGDEAYALIGGGVQPSGQPVVLLNLADTTAQKFVSAAIRLQTSTTSPPGAFVPLLPARVLDTRNGVGAPKQAVAPDGSVSLQLAGHGGVPVTGVAAVVLNVTSVSATRTGYVTVYPSGTTRPTASNLNHAAGATTPNLVTVRLGADGKIVLFNGSSGTTHLLADVAGYYLAGTPSAAGTFASLAPARILDTRSGLGAAKAPVAAGGTLSLTVAGAGSVPSSGVSSVVVNATVTGTTHSGYLTAYPSGTTRPVASNLNFAAGQTRANLATVRLGSDGKLRFFNGSSGTVQLIVDVSGYYLAGTPTEPGTFVSINPTRVLDTRNGIGAPKAALVSGQDAFVNVAGKDGVPAAGAAALVLNSTETQPTNGGYLTVMGADLWFDGTYPISTLNFVAAQTSANLAIPGGSTFLVHNGTGGKVQAIADLAGYFRS